MKKHFTMLTRLILILAVIFTGCVQRYTPSKQTNSTVSATTMPTSETVTPPPSSTSKEPEIAPDKPTSSPPSSEYTGSFEIEGKWKNVGDTTFG